MGNTFGLNGILDRFEPAGCVVEVIEIRDVAKNTRVCGRRASSCALEDGVHLALCVNGLEPNGETPELGEVLHDLLGFLDLERTVAVLEVPQGEGTVPVTLIAHDLDVRHIPFPRVLLGKQL